MAAPVLLVEFTTDDPDDTTPSWTDVTEHVRAFSTSRGRDSELSLVEAGTASITLSNRGRDFDPTNDATLRPMNRWKISIVMDGPVTEEVFVGYAESYDQQWPATGKDAVTIVSCVDEFKVLALDNLPTMNPPRDTYADLVMFDQPAAYWRMNNDPLERQWPAVVGPTLAAEAGSVASLNDGAIVGDNPDPYGAFYNAVSGYIVDRFDDDGDQNNPLTVMNLTEFAIETWWDTDDITPASQEILIHGPTTGGATSWRLFLNTGGTVAIEARNSGGTLHTATSGVLTAGSPPSNPTWKHIVGTITGGNLRLYVNGTQVASTAWTGSFHGTFNAGSSFYVSDLAPLSHYVFDEVAFYRVGLPADRVLAHYEAGRLRGFPRAQNPGDRMEAVLDEAGNVAPRSIQTGTHAMVGTFMRGQPPLEEMRLAEQAENVDAVLFIARDGTITFLADNHRSSSPYNTVQATFDDDGTDLPYQGIDVDYSESFLFNEWTVTKVGGTTTTETDATSVGAFLKRSRSLTDLPITDDADQDAIAADLLAKYKDPLFRVTSLDLLATEAVAEAVFPLDIGHRIRVFRTQPGGGRIDQTLFIQKIDTAGEPGRPIQVRLSVSPL